MNCIDWDILTVCGGYHARIRFHRDASPKPIKGRGGYPITYASTDDAKTAILNHLCRYFNTEMVRDGVTVEAIRAADAVFNL